MPYGDASIGGLAFEDVSVESERHISRHGRIDSASDYLESMAWKTQRHGKCCADDFIDKDLGRANPSRVYDAANDTDRVSVRTDHDTFGFAVATLRQPHHRRSQRG